MIRRYFQFRLRSMMIACVGVGLIAGWLGNAQRQHQFETASVKRLFENRSSYRSVRLRHDGVVAPTSIYAMVFT